MAYFIIVSVYGEYPCTQPLLPLSISAAKRNLMNSSYTLIFFLHLNNLLCWLGCPEQQFCYLLARLKAEKPKKVVIGFLLLPTSFCIGNGMLCSLLGRLPMSIPVCSSAEQYLHAE
jgi:hypothetical protein